MPSANIGRSVFDLSHSVKTTFNVGDVVPIDRPLEVLPGDTFNVKTSKVIRLQTMLTPMMDNLYFDVYHFFVPMRLVWQHTKEFMGENSQSAWIPQSEKQIPQITAPASTGWTEGTIADYFGVPTKVADLKINALPFRAYALIMNEWFRDQNLTDPLNIPVGDSDQTGSNGSSYINDVANGGMPFKAAKYHDYFTSALPGPQKGPAVPLPVASTTFSTAPVYGNGISLGLTDGQNGAPMFYDSSAPYQISALMTSKFGSDVGTSESGQSGTLMSKGTIGVATKEVLGDHPEYSGLIADLDGFNITIGNINDLRLAFQTQKFYEKLARGGSRYTEILRSMFGVVSPDARLQRPEYLGGSRVPLNINQVVQSSASQAQSGLTTTPQGTVTAFSLTTDTHHDFKHSFTEHGYVISVGVVRYDHTYQQGLNRLWSRKNRFDFYWPVFANIGEQAIYNKEIFAQGSSTLNPDTGNPYDDEVFGYQEAWADYRYQQNFVTGEMRSNAIKSLDPWHLADDYSQMPYLSDEWIREDHETVDRVLAVTSSVSNQVFMDMFIKNIATRPMPMYSIPGLIDHH